MAAGLKQKVDQITQKYAAEDAAWAPHENTIRAHGKDRAATVTQLMNWFQELSQNPLVAFPALVRSMGHEKTFQQHLQQQQAQQQPQQGDPFQQYAASVKQRLNGFQQTIQQQQEAQGLAAANAVPDEFKKSRPHFERVRGAMSALIGRGILPLTPEGAVPLQEAYDMAVRMDPELGEQLIAERMSAEKKRQREQAERARRAGSSLGGAAPGGNNSLGAPKTKRGRSVKESLYDSIDELAGR